VAKGLTQEGLAESIGVSTRYLQSIEAGEYWPTLPLLLKLRDKLGPWDRIFAGCSAEEDRPSRRDSPGGQRGG